MWRFEGVRTKQERIAAVKVGKKCVRANLGPLFKAVVHPKPAKKRFKRGAKKKASTTTGKSQVRQPVACGFLPRSTQTMLVPTRMHACLQAR